MPELQTHHLVPFAPDLMFKVVADIEAYPQFVSETVEVITTRMAIRYKIFMEHYTSRVTLDRAALAIDVAQTQGPFHFLINTWRFEPVGEGTKIHFYLNYELRSRSMNLLMGPLFQKLFKNFESAFEKRAAALYSA